MFKVAVSYLTLLSKWARKKTHIKFVLWIHAGYKIRETKRVVKEKETGDLEEAVFVFKSWGFGLV